MNIIASIELEKGLNILDELKQIQRNAAQCHEDTPINVWVQLLDVGDKVKKNALKVFEELEIEREFLGKDNEKNI